MEDATLIEILFQERNQNIYPSRFSNDKFPMAENAEMKNLLPR